MSWTPEHLHSRSPYDGTARCNVKRRVVGLRAGYGGTLYLVRGTPSRKFDIGGNGAGPGVERLTARVMLRATLHLGRTGRACLAHHSRGASTFSIKSRSAHMASTVT